MFEAILFIWLGQGNTQTLSATRYDTMEQCEEARKVTIEFVKKNSAQSTEWIQCKPVVKVSK